jgi:DNA-3-methyladenine glycosylase II
LIEYKKIIITEQEKEQLKASDPNMKLLVELVGDIDREYIPDFFVALVNSIVFQQLAYKAAITIWSRFEELIETVEPESILAHSFDELRACGLSKNKIDYLKNLSTAVASGELRLESIDSMSNEEIIESLVKVKGIGVWTAEMFLIFCLNRKDILSFKDLGIRKGIMWLYGMKGEPYKEQFEEVRRRFSPQNTLASFYLWEVTIRNLFRFSSVEDAFASLK